MNAIEWRFAHDLGITKGQYQWLKRLVDLAVTAQVNEHNGDNSRYDVMVKEGRHTITLQTLAKDKDHAISFVMRSKNYSESDIVDVVSAVDRAEEYINRLGFECKWPGLYPLIVLNDKEYSMPD